MEDEEARTSEEDGRGEIKGKGEGDGLAGPVVRVAAMLRRCFFRPSTHLDPPSSTLNLF
jgi:hypothetical protein